MSNLETRVRGLQTRLSELAGERDEKLDQLASDVAELKKDVKEILTLLRAREGGQ
ncbi:hypothetical protein JNUCC0626_18445 [Lentzea sp. JNUCC 0626]|uniref:hypothetical protein n=1 Tax=Lentzea sp. JNUCC 0626 TaxID=3367513 RepID=UPI0037489734